MIPPIASGGRATRTDARSAVVLAMIAFVAACDRPAQRPPAALVASTPAPRAPAIHAAPDPGFVGVVVAGEWVEVEAKVEGRVQELLVKPGDRVARGAPLARLDVATTLHELAIARAALVEAQRRFARRRKLARSGVISAEEIDTARRELLQERARVRKLEAARTEASVTAPVAGTVVERHLAAGALAGPGRPILRLLGEGAPQVRFAIPEEQAAAITAGSLVNVRVGPQRLPVRGRVVGVAPEVDTSSRMVFASAALEQVTGSPQALSTGVIARVFLPGAEAQP
jgi:RND family efflux transporter MFP subunit